MVKAQRRRKTGRKRARQSSSATTSGRSRWDPELQDAYRSAGTMWTSMPHEELTETSHGATPRFATRAERELIGKAKRENPFPKYRGRRRRASAGADFAEMYAEDVKLSRLRDALDRRMLEAMDRNDIGEVDHAGRRRFSAQGGDLEALKQADPGFYASVRKPSKTLDRQRDRMSELAWLPERSHDVKVAARARERRLHDIMRGALRRRRDWLANVHHEDWRSSGSEDSTGAIPRALMRRWDPDGSATAMLVKKRAEKEAALAKERAEEEAKARRKRVREERRGEHERRILERLDAPRVRAQEKARRRRDHAGRIAAKVKSGRGMR